EGGSAWKSAHAGLGDLSQPLRPGEHALVALVFDVAPIAAGEREGRLLVTAGEPESRLLIGHESSPGHPKVYFSLPAEGRAARISASKRLGWNGPQRRRRMSA
ncbi:MAG: hypothetical protein ABIT01_04985, partial [Thermoanaerobaculia bacterium]